MSYPTAVKTPAFADALAKAQERANRFGVAYFVYSWPENSCFTAASVDLFTADDMVLLDVEDHIVARVEPETVAA